jgi:hypothetical protein
MKFLRGSYGILKRLVIQSTWKASEKYNPPYLWSKGISRYCDFRGGESYWLEDTESCQLESFFRRYYVGANGLVWVRLSTQSRDKLPCDLDNFVREALPTIKNPFVLITTDGDASVPSDIRPATVDALLNCPWLVLWYTQNYDGYVHSKLAPFPIGIDLHTPRFCASQRRLIAQLEHIRMRRLPLTQTPLKVFCDLEVSFVSEERRIVAATLRNCSHVDFLGKRLSQNAIWRRYAEYPFVLSAAGNGLDCHRTWELLYLGNIVITKTSSLDKLFEGLPVVIVQDWKEVGDMENLKRWLDQYGSLTDSKTIRTLLDPNNLIRSIRESLVLYRR